MKQWTGTINAKQYQYDRNDSDDKALKLQGSDCMQAVPNELQLNTNANPNVHDSIINRAIQSCQEITATNKKGSSTTRNSRNCNNGQESKSKPMSTEIH